MTFEEVQELFIRAAYIERKMMRENVIPRAGSPWPRYRHEEEDIRGWSAADRRAREVRIASKGGSYGDARRTREAIGIWERATSLINIVRKESERRCLLAWSMAKAGGVPFVAFCQGEKIHVETGTRRKNRAIAEIVVKDQSAAPLDSEQEDFAVLPEPPETGHKTDTLAIDATTRGGAWRDTETEATKDTILSGWKANRTAWRRKQMAAR